MSRQQPRSPARTASEEYREVIMKRADLAHLPSFELPRGFSLRAYEAGDAAHWTAIHRRADAFNAFSDARFRDIFGHDEEALAVRQKFLLDPDGVPIGTATAWLDAPRCASQASAPREDGNEGRVHWVAIVPEFQGRGLAKPLLSEVLHALRGLGHTRAVLSTDSRRPAAIALYRSFGFTEVKG